MSENKEYLLNSVIDCSSAILCRKVLHINMAYVTHNIHNIPLPNSKCIEGGGRGSICLMYQPSLFLAIKLQVEKNNVVNHFSKKVL